MKHISLFNGIGGFQLAAEWMRWQNIASCEIDEWCNTINNYFYPECIQYEDIKTTDFTIHRGQCDILTGGFPCQPFSVAGKQLGTDDERHMWPQMLRAIREIRPRWIVGENVRGLVSWSDGLVFEQVQAQLEAEGYEVQSFVLPAAGVNAPHRRERVWIVAYAANSRIESMRREREDQIYRSELVTDTFSNRRSTGRVHDTEYDRTEFSSGNKHKDATTNPGSSRLWRQANGFGSSGQFNEKSQVNDWQNFPTQSPVCSRYDGFPGIVDFAPIPTITGATDKQFNKWRRASLKAYGNAIVPQVALQIFKAIEQYEKIYNHA